MKKIYFLEIFLLVSVLATGRPGISCSDPVPLFPALTCNNMSESVYGGNMQCPYADCSSFIMMNSATAFTNPSTSSGLKAGKPSLWLKVAATCSSFTINNGKAYTGPASAKANLKDYAVYSGICGSLELISRHTLGENQSVTISGLREGVEYYILASAADGSESHSALSVCITAAKAYEAKGNFCNEAISIREGMPKDFTNAGATPDGPEYYSSLENNTWYKWEVPPGWPDGQAASLRVFNKWSNSEEDLQISLWNTGGSCPDKNLRPAIVNRIPGDVTEYFYQWTPQTGSTVFISVDGYAGAAGLFNIEIRPENKSTADVININAGSDGQAVILEWVTHGEHMNDYFTVEKSRDGMNYFPLNIVDGAGNASSDRVYMSRDDYPFPGVNYYRLRMTDQDANYTYSKAVAIHVKGEGQLFHAWSSSMGRNIDIAYFSEAETGAMLRIYNATGAQVFSMPLQFAQGRNDYRINSGLFPEGNYKVRLETPLRVHFDSVSLESE